MNIFLQYEINRNQADLFRQWQGLLDNCYFDNLIDEISNKFEKKIKINIFFELID
jgi:hypothetical protein